MVRGHLRSLLGHRLFPLLSVDHSGGPEKKTDTDLLLQANGLAQIHLLQGMEMMRRAAILKAQAAGEQKMFFRLFYPSGVSFSSSNMTYWRNIGIDRDAVDAILEGGASYRYTTQKVPQQLYAARIIYKRIDRSIVLQLGYSLESEERLVNTFERTFAITMAVLLAIAVAVGWFMARRALSGVSMVTRTADRSPKTIWRAGCLYNIGTTKSTAWHSRSIRCSTEFNSLSSACGR